jgi:hypothetical protein
MNNSRVERVVLEALATQSSLHVIEISDLTNEHPVTVDLACARLHDNGDVASVGLGRYDITERGMRRREEHLADRPPEGSTS